MRFDPLTGLTNAGYVLDKVAAAADGTVYGIATKSGGYGGWLFRFGNNIALDTLQAVVDSYAPVVRFRGDEPYRMCSIDWFLLRAQLRGADGSSRHATRDDLP